VFYGQAVDHCGLDKEEKEFLKYKTFYGNEITASACRLAPDECLVKPINNIDIRHTLA
jgi:type I restriction enzyme M protein